MSWIYLIWFNGCVQFNLEFGFMLGQWTNERCDRPTNRPTDRKTHICACVWEHDCDFSKHTISLSCVSRFNCAFEQKKRGNDLSACSQSVHVSIRSLKEKVSVCKRERETELHLSHTCTNARSRTRMDSQGSSCFDVYSWFFF